jgi:hypothetical protein
MNQKVSNPECSKEAISYIPHILFIVAQIYCGIFIIFLMGPPLFAIINSYENGIITINFKDLFYSFPKLWSKFRALTTGEIILLIFSCFPIGYIFAEAFYRFAILIHYMREINLENLEEEITPSSETKHFKTRYYIQRDICFQRVWDWENFQASFCLYLEGTLVIFCYLFGLSILYTFIFGNDLQIFWIVICLTILLFSIFLTWLMRIARINKFKAFHNAHTAIEELLKNGGN